VRAGPRWSERGMVAGGEALVFGTLVLLAGALVLVNVWSVIETRAAVDAAAREYLRAYTRADDRDHALDAADLAARAALAARDTPLRTLRIVEPAAAQFGPCGRAEVTLIATVPAARVPFVGEVAATEVRVTHAELLGAHEEVTPHDRFDDRTTVCHGP
jgi:hypothetical protein